MNKAFIQKESFDFLKKLARNNNREWFSKHKDEYVRAHENMVSFASALLAEMNKHDNIETASGKDSLFRIYRDVRFSKDKTPYNAMWHGGFKRATKKLRGGYYFCLEPGKSFIGGGFWGPNTEDLQRIRQDIDVNFDEWNRMLAAKPLVQAFGSLQGEQLTSSPRGYAKDHPAVHLLRYKQFLLKHDFSDAEVLSPSFAKTASDIFKRMRPFLNFMSDILTTDVNGVSLVE